MIKTNGHVGDGIICAFKKYAELMGLDKWTITLRAKELTPEETEDGWQAETDAEAEYLRAVIDIYQVNIPPEEYERVARHELLHVITGNMFGIAETLAFKSARKAMRKLEERVITELEAMPLWDKIE